MPYRIVEGEFRLSYVNAAGRTQGSEPDGDSVWFKPANPELLRKVGAAGWSAKFNKGGLVQLRLEGIDALETHFEGKHQRWEPALAARDALLAAIGFGAVTYATPKNEGEKPMRVQTVAKPHPVKGYVLTRAIDSPQHGRPVAFAFAGKAPKGQNGELELGVAVLRRSVNWKLMKLGLVYPMYYTETLPTDLRDELTAQMVAARKAGRGVWKFDRTMTLTAYSSVESLEGTAIWPKLFRRLAKYFADGRKSVAGFEAWLREKPKDRDDALFIQDKAEKGNLHDVIEVKGDKLRMKYRPERLMVES